MRNQDKMQGMYNIKDPIEIMFDQMKTIQEFAIAGNSPFSNRQLEDMGVTKILTTQVYTHAYCIWKSITGNDLTWVRFTVHFQEA